jgi:hypothetical protein
MKQHVVIYVDENGNSVVNPATIHVKKGHLVVWCSNIQDALYAKNFRLRNPPGPKLFTESEFAIPQNDQGPSSAVLPTPSAGTTWTYDYDISTLAGHLITFKDLAGTIIDPVIIVDPPGTPDLLDQDGKKQRKKKR